MKNPLVSIVIATYNSEEYLDACLKSVFKNIYTSFEVLIVDNGSTDNTLKIVGQFAKNKELNLIKLESNFGYAGANNFGVESARGELIFFLNPDTLVEPGFLVPLINDMNSDQSLAAVQPLVYLFDKKTINLTGKKTHYLGFDWIKDYKSKKKPTGQRIYSFSGSGVLVKKKDFIEVGGFDDFYFMYYEDSDLSWKLILIGKKIIFNPNSIIYHDYKYLPKNSYQSLKQKIYFIERNRLITIIKNYTLKTWLIIFPMFLLVELAMVSFAFMQGWGTKKIKTYFDIFKNWDQVVKKRVFIQKLRKVSDKEIVSHFESQLLFEMFANAPVKYILNPLMSTYWYVAKKLF